VTSLSDCHYYFRCYYHYNIRLVHNNLLKNFQLMQSCHTLL
jgi:predicted glutamine amidotransferase